MCQTWKMENVIMSSSSIGVTMPVPVMLWIGASLDVDMLDAGKLHPTCLHALHTYVAELGAQAVPHVRITVE